MGPETKLREELSAFCIEHGVETIDAIEGLLAMDGIPLDVPGRLSVNLTAGEIAWVDFLHALRDRVLTHGEQRLSFLVTGVNAEIISMDHGKTWQMNDKLTFSMWRCVGLAREPLVRFGRATGEHGDQEKYMPEHEYYRWKRDAYHVWETFMRVVLANLRDELHEDDEDA